LVVGTIDRKSWQEGHQSSTFEALLSTVHDFKRDLVSNLLVMYGP
jgi:hypothetical protein